MGDTVNFSKLFDSEVKYKLGDPMGLIDPFTRSPHLIDAGMNTSGDTTTVNLWEFARTQVLAIFLGEFFASIFVGFIICYAAGLSFATVIGIGYNATTLGFGVGLAVFVGVAVFGHVSGGHANPALTLLLYVMHLIHYFWEGGIWLIITRTILLITAWIAQFAGWIIAAAIVWYTLDEPNTKLNPGLPGVLGGINGVARDLSRAFFAEFCACVIFYSVFAFGVIDRRSITPALEMGFTVGAITMAMAGQTGGIMNPMRWLTTAIVNNRYNRDWVVYIWPPLIAIIGVVILVEIWRRFIEPVAINRDPAMMSPPQFPPHNKYMEHRKENAKKGNTNVAIKAEGEGNAASRIRPERRMGGAKYH